MEDWLNQKTRYDTVPESTEKADTEETDTKKTPFERLVKNIKTSDLNLADKKQQIHYAKYAMMNMDEEQSEKFVSNIKTLIRLKEMNSSGEYEKVSRLFSKDYSAEVEKALEKLEALKEKISLEKKSFENATDSDSSMEDKIRALLKSSAVEVTESLTVSYKAYSSSVLDRYVENVNLKYEAIVSSKTTKGSSSVDLVA